MLLAFRFLKEKRICETKEENFSFIAFERNIVDQKGKQFRNRKISVHWIQMNFHDFQTNTILRFYFFICYPTERNEHF